MRRTCVTFAATKSSSSASGADSDGADHPSRSRQHDHIATILIAAYARITWAIGRFNARSDSFQTLPGVSDALTCLPSLACQKPHA